MKCSIQGWRRHVYLVTVRSPNNQKPFQNIFWKQFHIDYTTFHHIIN